MFDDRMNEHLVWGKLDLDKIKNDVSTHGLIIPICHQIESWGIDNLLDKHVRVNQKVYDFTPNQKIMQVLASNMFGCEDNKRMNKVLREDNPEYSKYFGLPVWVEQSVVSDTFRAMAAENISQLEMVWQESLEVTQVIEGLRRRIESGEYITIDIDLTGDICKSKDDPTVTKGYFPNKRGKTGRQKAWAYITDDLGKIQQLLALEYGSGKMKLHHCLPSLLEKIIKLLGVEDLEHHYLRKRVIIRTDAAGGTPRNIGILEEFGVSYFLKGYSYKVAKQVCDKVEEWHEIPDKDGGYFGISSKTPELAKDQPNLENFRTTIPRRRNPPLAPHLRGGELAETPVPQFVVFGFRQKQEEGKIKNSHYITNVSDYLRLSTDGTLTGTWRYYHKRASIESSVKTERNILHTAHKRGRKFFSSWGYLIVAAIAYNLLYLLRDLFFSDTEQDNIGMKDFVRDAINIKCQINTQKGRGQPVRYVSLILDEANKYAKAFFKKVKENTIGQLLLPFSWRERLHYRV
jgi:hypothetical protein